MGKYDFLQKGKKDCLLIHRSLKGQHLLCALNLTGTAKSVELDLAPFKGNRIMDLLSSEEFPKITAAPYTVKLPAYAYRWLKITR